MAGGENEEEEGRKNEGAGKWQGRVEKVLDLRDGTQAELLTPEILLS